MNNDATNRNLTAWGTLSVLGLATLGGMPLLASEGPAVKRTDEHGNTVTGEQSSPLQFAKGLMFWEIVAFVFLLIALSIIVFPKMFGAMHMRQERIENALAKADRVNAEADALLKKHERMMAEAQAEAKRISDEALAAAARTRNEIVESAKKEAAEVVARAKNEIRLAQNKAMAELRHDAAELSLIGSSAVLSKVVSGDDHRRLASEAIAAASASMANRN
jgi:F-type H+-transporting ATPase subunit b